MKLNSDGSVHRGEQTASAAGVIRNDQGQWLLGYGCNLGACTVPEAELWGLFQGLQLAWVAGFRRLEAEVDSQLLISLLHKELATTHPLHSLVSACQGFLSRDWHVQFRHIYREANRVADSLADLASSFDPGVHVLHQPPTSCSILLFDDIKGTKFPRRVVM